MILLLQSAAATATDDDGDDDDDDKLMIPCSSAITVWTTVSIPRRLSRGRLTVQIILNDN